MTVHNGAYLFFRLFSFQSSFFLWTTLSLFLMFLFAFIFLSLIAHVCFSVIENECSALRFLLFKQGTPRPVTRQVPSVEGCRRTSASGWKADVELIGKPLKLGSAFGRGCVKTQNRPLETASKIGDFSVEVSCLLTARYRLASQSIASHVVFEGDFWREIVAEF